jgi:hypothetical protein
VIETGQYIFVLCRVYVVSGIERPLEKHDDQEKGGLHTNYTVYSERLSEKFSIEYLTSGNQDSGLRRALSQRARGEAYHHFNIRKK